MTESIVGRFGVRKKYCSLADKLWLISQIRRSEPADRLWWAFFGPSRDIKRYQNCNLDLIFYWSTKNFYRRYHILLSRAYCCWQSRKITLKLHGIIMNPFLTHKIKWDRRYLKSRWCSIAQKNRYHYYKKLVSVHDCDFFYKLVHNI